MHCCKKSRLNRDIESFAWNGQSRSRGFQACLSDKLLIRAGIAAAESSAIYRASYAEWHRNDSFVSVHACYFQVSIIDIALSCHFADWLKRPLTAFIRDSRAKRVQFALKFAHCVFLRTVIRLAAIRITFNASVLVLFFFRGQVPCDRILCLNSSRLALFASVL